MKNKVYFLVFLILFSSHLVRADNTVHKKIMLILGFESPLLNDVQDRLLRETIMRGFHNRGYLIVPVMRIESLFHGDRKRKIRTASRADITEITEELDADFAISGSIFSSKGERRTDFNPGEDYICRITFFCMNGRKFFSLKFNEKGRENLYDFFNSLADKIVSGVINKI